MIIKHFSDFPSKDPSKDHFDSELHVARLKLGEQNYYGEINKCSCLSTHFALSANALPPTSPPTPENAERQRLAKFSRKAEFSRKDEFFIFEFRKLLLGFLVPFGFSKKKAMLRIPGASARILFVGEH